MSKSWALNPGRRRNMQANRSRDTKPELRVRSLLHARGMRFRVNYRPLPKVQRTADIVFTRARVAVFVDGCWWHKCPDHYKPPARNTNYWLPKLDRNVRRDREIDQLLREAGWTVIRAWEHQDPGEVADWAESAVRGGKLP